MCACPEKCIKRAGTHQNRLWDASSPRYANCGSEHWANDEECPAVIRAIKLRKDGEEINQPHQGKRDYQKPTTISENN